MNENLMNGIKHIIAGQGEEPLTDAARFRPILAEYVPDAPRPLAAALGNCVENGAYTALKTAWGAAERAARKAVLVQRLHGEYGLDGALAGEALDILETALFDAESVPEQPPAPESTPAVPPGPAVSVPEPVPPRGARPQCVKTLKRPAVIAAGAALVLALGTVWGILPAYWNKRGAVHIEKEEWDQAIAAYGNVLRLRPNNAAAYLRRGDAFRDKGDFDRAIADITEAIRLAPDNADVYIGRGRAYNMKEHNDAAITDFDQAIWLAPDNADVYIGRGRAYYMKEHNDAAIADFTQAIRLAPDNAEAYYGRGLASYQKKNYHHAIADLREAVRLDPTNAVYKENLAIARSQGW